MVKGEGKSIGMRKTYLIREILRDTKALLLSQFLETATAPVHCVLSSHVGYWEDDKGQEPEDYKCHDCEQKKERMTLMLYVSDDIHVAIGALLPDWTIHQYFSYFIQSDSFSKSLSQN